MTRAPGLDWSQSISQRMSQIKTAVFIAALVPLAVMVYDGFTGGLGSNPVEEITHRTGEWGLRFLLLTLTITPLRRLMGINTLVRLRRMLGLYAFFYASLHFTTYVWLDAYFDLAYIVEDVVKRLYITVGFSAFVLLIPLALTSNDAMIRRLGGARWRLLHRLSYVAAIGGVLHFLWLVKATIANRWYTPRIWPWCCCCACRWWRNVYRRFDRHCAGSPAAPIKVRPYLRHQSKYKLRRTDKRPALCWQQ